MVQKKILCLSNELKSHPEKTLKKHLFNVGDLCKSITSRKYLNLDRYVDRKIFEEISYLIGITHDFGKSTNYFQEYITEHDEKRKYQLKNKQETHHALLSSIFTYYTIKQYLSNKGLRDKDYYKNMPIICFFIVKRHHGNLHNSNKELDDFSEKKLEILDTQIKSINIDKVKEIYGEVDYVVDIETFKNKFKKTYERNEYRKNIGSSGCTTVIKKYPELLKDLIQEKKNIEKIDDLFYYFSTLFLYSILLDADKMDASGLVHPKRKTIPSEIVDNYKQLKFKEINTKINKIRNEIYEETISKVKNINLEQDKILSLNVPTGTGKTLTSLSFALKLRKRIENENGYMPRIIYSLPFLSIIDQNFDVFDKLLYHPTTDILLKHHHLSDVEYTTEEDEFENIDKDVGKDLLLIEGWNSEIIVTTFIQFFYSIISKRNKAIRKYHNIANSIIILDEVQAIPHEYWLLLNKTVKFFAEHFNTYFILITATQPLIFDEKKNEITPLVSKKNKEKYFKTLDRVKLVLNLKPMIIDKFKEILRKDIAKKPNKDILIVLNTINSSKQVFDFVNELGLKAKDTELYYLSTNIIPKKRLEKIKCIKAKNRKRKIIISTQLIEAGVDIDVDIVYRDFAPLDSINQVSGRCNRNFGDEKGNVKIFILRETEDKKDYYKHIYGSFLTTKTEIVLKKNEINECEFLKLNDNYFKEVDIGKSKDKSNEILKSVEGLKFDDLSEFKLIENTYQKIDVFVEFDNDARTVWNKYLKIINNKKLKGFKKKNEFLKIKKQFYDYVISVPIKHKNDVGYDDVLKIGYISKKEINNGISYDVETGFKSKNTCDGTLFDSGN